MDIFFKYNGKLFSTPNLEKKLKKMKLSINDIEILPPKEVKEDTEENIDKEYVRVYSTKDDIIRVVIVPKGERPPIDVIFKNQMYNPDTKTGVYTDISTFYYEGTI